METADKPGMTKRKALLALLGAAPALMHGQEFTVELPEGSGDVVLLELRFDADQGLDTNVLFLRVLVNGKEEVRLSLREALDILKG